MSCFDLCFPFAAITWPFLPPDLLALCELEHCILSCLKSNRARNKCTQAEGDRSTFGFEGNSRHFCTLHSMDCCFSSFTLNSYAQMAIIPCHWQLFPFSSPTLFPREEWYRNSKSATIRLCTLTSPHRKARWNWVRLRTTWRQLTSTFPEQSGYLGSLGASHWSRLPSTTAEREVRHGEKWVTSFE